MKPKPLGPAAVALVASVLAGCLGPVVPTIDVSTSYSRDVTDQGHRDRVRALGFESGGPAHRGTAQVWVHVTDSVGGDLRIPENATPGETLDLGHYAIPLDDDGQVSFRIRTEDPSRVKIAVRGGFDTDDCKDGRAHYEGGTAYMPAYAEREEGAPAGSQGYLPEVEDDVALDLPFGIECPEPDER